MHKNTGNGAKHSPPSLPQGGPLGNFGGSSCGWFFSSLNRCLWHQKQLQKHNSNKITGFKLWEIRWRSWFFSSYTGTVRTRPHLGSFLGYFHEKSRKSQEIHCGMQWNQIKIRYYCSGRHREASASLLFWFHDRSNFSIFFDFFQNHDVVMKINWILFELIIRVVLELQMKRRVLRTPLLR